MRKGTLVFGAVLVALAYWYWIVPFGTEAKPRLVSTPSPFARYEPEPVVVGPGQTACLDRIGLSPRIGRAIVRTLRPTRAELELTLRGPGGYTARATAQTPPKPGDVGFRIAGPPDDAIGEACIANRGRAAVSLSGTSDPRIQTRSVTKVEGKPVGPDAGLIFLERDDESLRSLAGPIVDRMTTWKPFFLDAWLAWLLVPLVGLGIPAGLLWAYASARELP